MIANYSPGAFLTSTLLGILWGILSVGIVIVLVVLFRSSAKKRAMIESASLKRFTPEAETAWDQLHGKIEQELNTLRESEWAGVYYHGDGLGVNATLTLAPRNGFVFLWLGCLGVYDRNYGGVTLSERGTIQLSCEFETRQKGYRELAQEFVSIIWDERRYLIPPNMISQFRKDLKAKKEPRKCVHGPYFLRAGDHEKAVTGLPELPDVFNG
ncbi:MAG: hypothetical protein DHS20C16_18440 [Phycisphaerae bacterium]|nr:MAG: hypothetical protein DHS20C16_18440 [Phycisphaerae bacterium]